MSYFSIEEIAQIGNLLYWKTSLPEIPNAAIIPVAQSGRGAVRLARLHGVQEVGGSNPLAPTESKKKPACRKAGFDLSRWFPP